MKSAYIIRTSSGDQGTKGILVSNNFDCYSLELPWRNNESNISCISEGVYHAEMRISQRLGKHYWIKDVEGRVWILVHSGNLAGDITKGFLSHVQGCILLGKKYGILRNQLAILLSKPTVTAFENYMERKSFVLGVYNFYKEVI
jgi:hypothetical protein